MENASKALIIAGAILLSILLISLGIVVYNKANDTIGNANLDSETIQTFNNKITAYCGKNKTYKEMNALVDAISSINGAQNGLADQHYVGVELGSGTTASTGGNITVDELEKDASAEGNSSTSDGFSYPTFSAGHKYTAEYKTDKTGYIINVKITAE